MTTYEKLRHLVIGKPLDPFSASTRKHVALAAFFAWVGLGADGLSSSAYGPEEAFRALGVHTHLGLYMAVVTAATVFIISLGYNQVIELFPTGGGGYRVATSLIGPRAGLVSGAGLMVDYVLTIAISIASGVDALFSLLPSAAGGFKLSTELVLTAILLMLNLRGMKEPIWALMPIFLGFFISHAVLISYGILGHAQGLASVVPETIAETHTLAQNIGWMATLSLFLRAYSLGGGTYTGIEAVSNNVHTLREPRVRTGKVTMFYMAASLAFTAGGIVLLYLLWNAHPVQGRTLNAVVFGTIIESFGLGSRFNQIALMVVLVTEAGLLFVAANTGFLGGPAVLSNMAADSWLPHQFRHLSTRLVTQNGIVIMGLAALVILLWSRGSVDLLVVLYSINVFLTFTLSLLGLCIYWWCNRATDRRWSYRLVLSALGFVLTSGILGVTLVEKFGEGGWVTVVITSLVIAMCLAIHRHYDWVKARLKEVDEIFSAAPCPKCENPPPLDPQAPTAAFMVGSSRGGGIHTVLWVQRLFPNHFRNFIFISAKAVDAQSYGGAEQIDKMRSALDRALSFYVNYCNANGLAATARYSLGTDRVDELVKQAEEIQKEYPNCVFFTSKLVFRNENWITRLLHNQTALALQRRLHLSGMQMVILPMQL
jgi:amino acid permease-like protein